VAEALRSLTAEKLKEALQADAASHKRCKTKVLDVAVQLLHQEITSAFSEALGASHEPCANGLEIKEEDASTYHLCLSCVDMDQVPLQTRQAHVDFQKNVKCRANLTCTQCRRPLEIDLHWQELHRPIKALAQVRKAYCAVLKDSKESSFLQALSLGMGLDKHCGVKERVLIHGPAVPAAFLEVLRPYWYLEPSRGSWLEVLNRNIIQDERLTMLRALSLKYDKVLVLQLGIVVNSDLDDIFNVTGSAFVASQGRSRPTWPLMLLEPSNQALRRISMETAHPWQYPSFPPRRGAEQDDISTYLASFFRSFSKSDLQQLPSEFCSEAEGDARTFFCTDNAWSRQKPGPLQGLRASLPSYAEVVASNFEMMAKVSQQRCVTCSFSDAMGKKDECDGRWRCRFCREHLLLQGAKDLDFQLPLPDYEARDLRAKLKQFFLTGRQRWFWIAGKWQRGWLEFRPANVVWHSRHGVGTWHMWTDASGTTQLAVHLQHALEESGPQPYQNRQMSNLPNRDLPKEEWRYTLVSSGGSMPIFEETNRKVFRALGFAWEGSKSSNLGRIRLEAQSPVDPRDPEEAAESPDNGSAEASIAAAAPAPAAGSSAGESGRDVRSRLSYLLKPKGAPVRSPPAVPPPTKAEPSETTAAPSEVKPEPLKEPPKPPLDAEAAEAKNLRTGDTSDTSDTNGIKSLDSPEVSASPVETTEGSQQSSTVPEAPEAPRSVAREKLAYLLRK